MFEPPGPEGRPVPALHAAVNLDINDAGEVSRRDGLAGWVTAATAGKAVFSGLGLLLMQDGGKILKITGEETSAELVTGLNADARVSFCEHAGQVFWTNGAVTGRITAAGAAANWGCATTPTATVSTTSGDLPAGIYQITTACYDAAGIEHSAPKAVSVTLDGTKDITVSLSSVDANATHVRIYATRRNGTELFWCKTVTRAAILAPATVTVTDVAVSNEPLRTQFFSPPIAGSLLFPFRGMMMIGLEQYLYPSYGANVHLYEIAKAVEGRPSTILAGVGLDLGFWTVTSRGAFWTQGDEPGQWQTFQRDAREYCAGSLVIQASKVPWLGLQGNIALFASESGLMAGTGDGQIITAFPERQRLTVTNKRASFAYLERGELRKLIFSLV
jgi:hypothetical protein